MITVELKQVDSLVMGPLIKTDVAAILLSCTTRKVSDMCKKGEIKAVKVGSDWRINTAAFLKQFGIDSKEQRQDTGEDDGERS